MANNGWTYACDVADDDLETDIGDPWMEPPVADWESESEGYTVSHKLGFIADYIGDTIDSMSENRVVSSMALAHDYSAGYLARYLRNGQGIWGVEHRYPRFWTAEPVAIAALMAEKPFVGLYAFHPTQEEVWSRFERDRDAWLTKSAMMSSIVDMAMLPEYQRIIGLGPAAVPLIIRELREAVDHWFWALVAIVGEDHGAGALTVADAATKWIAWFDALSSDE